MEPIAMLLIQQDLMRQARSALPSAPVVCEVEPSRRVRRVLMHLRAARRMTRDIAGRFKPSSRSALALEP